MILSTVGSVIRPLLSPLFVNDLRDALEALTLLFADDVKKGYSAETENEFSQLSYCRMGLVAEMGPTNQSC